MINERMFQSHDDETEFTKVLKHQIEKNGPTYVEIRNGSVLSVVYQEETDDCSPGFRRENHSMYWYNDGKSITSYDYDIVKILGNIT